MGLKTKSLGIDTKKGARNASCAFLDFRLA